MLLNAELQNNNKHVLIEILKIIKIFTLCLRHVWFLMEAFKVVHTDISKPHDKVVGSQANAIQGAQPKHGSKGPGYSWVAGKARSWFHERRQHSKKPRLRWFRWPMKKVPPSLLLKEEVSTDAMAQGVFLLLYNF